MCLTPLKREILTAEDDIPVFKVLDVSPLGFYSPVYRTKWELNETKTVLSFSGKIQGGQYRNVRFTDVVPANVDRIYEGLHSFRESPIWIDRIGQQIFRMTIPKGTKYILGENGDIVSLALRFSSEMEIDFWGRLNADLGEIATEGE